MNSKTASRPALDRSDERVQHNDGLFGVVRAQINRIKTGDLGTAPVIAGLIVISLVFTWLNPVYIAPNNLVNLLFDCATVGFISLGSRLRTDARRNRSFGGLNERTLFGDCWRAVG